MPFDFDGKRLLWLKYMNKDVRQVSIYYFEEMREEVVYTFKKGAGMISHMKFLKNLEGGGKYLVYVKDTQEIVLFNIETKHQKVIGKASDAIIATYVSYSFIREKDYELLPENYNRDDLEGSNPDHFQVICLDESQRITIFDQKEALTKKEFLVQHATEITDEVAKKDLFGMGYPYFICMYGHYIACSSDYGVLFLELQ